MNGRELKQAILELGSVAAFSRMSEISTTTLAKLFRDEFIAEATKNKALATLALLKEQRKAAIARAMAPRRVATG